jgi:hypothetical protein
VNAETLVRRQCPKRSRVLMTGRLFLPDGVHQVTIRDISEKGARLRTDADVMADCDAILKRRPLFAAARVVWSNRQEVGLEFYRPLTGTELEQTFNYYG